MCIAVLFAAHDGRSDEATQAPQTAPPATEGSPQRAAEIPTPAVAAAPTIGSLLTQELPGGIKLTPQGRIEADALWITQSALNKAAVGDLQNTTGFRRARFGARIEIADNVEWMSEFDFGNGTFRVTDVYLGLVRLPVVGEFRVGQFREPFGLEAQTTSNAITFLERGQNIALVPGREFGIGLFKATPDRLGTLAAGAFRSGSDSSGRDSSDQNDMAYTARATRLFWYDDSDDPHFLHLGAAYSFQRPPNDTVVLNFQGNILEQGDSPLDPLLVTPVIPANRNHIFGFEAASVWGRFSLQTEWTAMLVPQLAGNSVFYHGAYAQVSFFLTGDHRAYDLRRGAFAPVQVLKPFGVGGERRGFGALELTFRYAYLDLSDPDAPLAANGLKPGGRVDELTFGLNWYLNSYSRLMMNYSPTVLVNPNTGTSHASYFGIRFAAFW